MFLFASDLYLSFRSELPFRVNYPTIICHDTQNTWHLTLNCTPWGSAGVAWVLTEDLPTDDLGLAGSVATACSVGKDGFTTPCVERLLAEIVTADASFRGCSLEKVVTAATCSDCWGASICCRLSILFGVCSSFGARGSRFSTSTEACSCTSADCCLVCKADSAALPNPCSKRLRENIWPKARSPLVRYSPPVNGFWLAVCVRVTPLLSL